MRWRRILPAGVMTLTGYGIFVYGASGFIAPVEEQAPMLSHSIVPYCATLRSLVFAAFNLLFGKAMLRSASPRTLVLIGTGSFGVGIATTAASVAVAPSHALLLLGFGVATGVGSGLVYMSIFTPTLAWFADRKGLVAGLLGAGQGLGATLWNAAASPLSRALPASSMLLLYGGLIGSCWGWGALVTWPPGGGPPAAAATRGRCGLFADCDAKLLLLWCVNLIGMASGFGVFTVLQARLD